MTERPDLSICIVNWNGLELLRDLLESVKTCNAGLKLQTIVVDNASHDGSAELVAREHPDVLLVRNQTNRGFAIANNQAVECATGRHLLFLNNDTVVLPGALAQLVGLMDAHPQYAAAGPKLIGADGKPQRTARNFPSLRALLHQRVMIIHALAIFRAQYRHYRYRDFDPEKSGEVPQLAAAALIIRPDQFNAVGRWDEKFRFGVEDVDLCQRLARCGPIYYLAEAQIRHLGRISSRANFGFTYSGYECGYARYLAKHHRQRSAALIYKTLVTLDTPLRILVLAIQLAVYRLLGRRDSAERTRRRFTAVSEFFFRHLFEFWCA
jgi:GT2 family glycosyltransferase